MPERRPASTPAPARDLGAGLVADFVCRVRLQARLQGIMMLSEAVRSARRIRSCGRGDPSAARQCEQSLLRIERLMGQLSRQLERQRRAVLGCVRASERARATGLVDREARAALTVADRSARAASNAVRRASPKWDRLG